MAPATEIPPEAAAVLDRACRHYGTTRAAILARDRRWPQARARTVVMAALCSRGWTQSAVGRLFARDHSTVEKNSKRARVRDQELVARLACVDPDVALRELVGPVLPLHARAAVLAYLRHDLTHLRPGSSGLAGVVGLGILARDAALAERVAELLAEIGLGAAAGTLRWHIERVGRRHG